MQIFEGNEYELKQKFSLSPMSVVCIGILRNKNIYLTEPLLEMCAKGGPLEGFLKERSLAGALDNPKEWQALHAKYDPECLYEVVLLDEGRRKILALQMEIAAEAGWQREEKSLPEKQGGMALSNLDHKMQSLASFFSQDEIQKLKVTLATTVHAKEKREAIRKMALSEVSGQEKSILFLHTLADQDREVRSEAAKALEQIGINHEISQAIQNLTQGDRPQRLHSIGSLGKLFSEGNDLEKAAILQIFMATFRDLEYKEFRIPIFQSMILLCPYIPDRATSMLEQIMFCAMDMMVSHLSDVISTCSSLFSMLAQKDLDKVVSFLTKEIEKAQDTRLRAFLLVLLSENAPGSLSDALVGKMIFEISLGDELDPIYRNLGVKIVDLGEKAVPHLLERFSITIRATERIRIAKLFSVILAEKMLSLSSRKKILESYTYIFPSAPDILRILILDTALLKDPEISTTLKTEFAKEILLYVHRDRLDQFSQAVKAALCKMKKPAVDALIHVLKNPLHEAQSVKAAEILGDVVLNISEIDKESLLAWKNFCFEEAENTGNHKGHLFCVLGKLASCPKANAEFSEEICEYLLAHLCKTSYPYLLLEGIGFAVASAYISHETRYTICQLFMALMDRRLPENLIKEKKQGESKIYECSVKTSAYTDLLPVLLQGFLRLAVSSNILPTLRSAIIRYLLEKWEQLVSYKILWGPKNTTDLAETLYFICMDKATQEEERVGILRALCQKISIFSITEMISNLLVHCTGKKIEPVAEEISLSVLELCQSDDYKNQEDREILLRCVGRMVQSKKLARTKKKTDEIREKFLYNLFDGLRDQIFGVKEILEGLLDCPYLSKKDKMSIEKRLPKKSLFPLENQ